MMKEMNNEKNRFLYYVLLIDIAIQICAAVNRRPRAKPRVALVMKSLANEFFKTMEEGAQRIIKNTRRITT